MSLTVCVGLTSYRVKLEVVSKAAREEVASWIRRCEKATIEREQLEAEANGLEGRIQALETTKSAVEADNKALSDQVRKAHTCTVLGAGVKS